MELALIQSSHRVEGLCGRVVRGGWEDKGGSGHTGPLWSQISSVDFILGAVGADYWRVWSRDGARSDLPWNSVVPVIFSHSPTQASWHRVNPQSTFSKRGESRAAWRWRALETWRPARRVVGRPRWCEPSSGEGQPGKAANGFESCLGGCRGWQSMVNQSMAWWNVKDGG